MKKELLILLLFAASSSVFAQKREVFNNLNIPEDTVIEATNAHRPYVESITAEVKKIDDLISTNQDQVELMAITYGSDKPVKVINREWPDRVVVSINILRRPNGQLYYYAEYPMSESGDWDIGYSHYFDSEGNVIAFRRIANFFNSECTDGVAKERSIYTFDKEFYLTSKSYQLTNSDGEDISRRACWFNYDYEYTIAKTNKEVVK